VIRRISLLVMVALVAATMVVATAVPVFAQSRAERECAAQGGEFTRVGPGQYECVIVTEEDVNPGNPQSENAATPQTETEETTQPQTGQGVGGGAQGEETTLNCVYNPSGNLQENRSDPGCPEQQA
jgi:hypothetical protein